MTMKSVYIVYITNCFLWTMSDNKTYLILSYLILIVVACPDRGAGNDREALGLAFHQGSTFISAYYQAATNLVFETEDYQSKLLSIQVSYQSN